MPSASPNGAAPAASLSSVHLHLLASVTSALIASQASQAAPGHEASLRSLLASLSAQAQGGAPPHPSAAAATTAASPLGVVQGVLPFPGQGLLELQQGVVSGRLQKLTLDKADKGVTAAEEKDLARLPARASTASVAPPASGAPASAFSVSPPSEAPPLEPSEGNSDGGRRAREEDELTAPPAKRAALAAPPIGGTDSATAGAGGADGGDAASSTAAAEPPAKRAAVEARAGDICGGGSGGAAPSVADASMRDV